MEFPLRYHQFVSSGFTDRESMGIQAEGEILELALARISAREYPRPLFDMVVPSVLLRQLTFKGWSQASDVGSIPIARSR
jgi:hypothetical protein